MSQHQKILKKLRRKNGVCTSEIYAMYIANPSARIHELQQKYNLLLKSIPCRIHNHKGAMIIWKIDNAQHTQ